MSHWSDGIYWKRLADGSVWLVVRDGKEPGARILVDRTIPAEDWPRVVAHLSAQPDAEAVRRAASLHGVEAA